MDRQTDRILIARPHLHSMQHGKNYKNWLRLARTFIFNTDLDILHVREQCFYTVSQNKLPPAEMLSQYLERKCPTEKVQCKFYKERTFFTEKGMGQFIPEEKSEEIPEGLSGRFFGGVTFSPEISENFQGLRASINVWVELSVTGVWIPCRITSHYGQWL